MKSTTLTLILLLASLSLISTVALSSARRGAFGDALTPSDGESSIEIIEEPTIKEFDNPLLALAVINKLNVIPPVPKRYPNTVFLKRDPDYCLKANEYFVKNPKSVFEEVNFLCDYNIDASYFRKDIIPMIGKDVMPFLNSKYIKFSRAIGGMPIEPSVNNYFFKLGIEYDLQLGAHIACMAQNYNHIPGSSDIANKDMVAHNMKVYTEKYQSMPQCSPGDKFFPQTWLLSNEKECNEWFNYVNSPAYEAEKAQKTIVFIRKIGAYVHRGAGVQPVDAEEEKALRDQYNNGAKCGKDKENIIVQRYISNPLLVYGHKFDFRVYMVISSTAPLTVYYHDGFLRVSLYEYDIHSTVKGSHLTNTALNEDVFKDKELQAKMGMNETELRNFQMWNYTRLATYLLERGKITSLDWVDTYLRPKIEHAMQHLVRITQKSLTKQSNLWELYGVDFMLDDDLNLWFIECNRSPVIKASSEEKGLFLNTLFIDLYEILSAQLRSRMKRVIKFVNMLTKEGFAQPDPNDELGVLLPNLEENRKIFNQLQENTIDDEFRISPTNSWLRIVDETKPGEERYNGMFPIECFE